MAESIIISTGTKEEQYQSLIPQINEVLSSEDDLIANMANTCAMLKEQFGWFWVGFYMVKNNQLVLGPFQGPLACTRIDKGRGVCGKAWEEARSIVVPNVNEFSGHIACSSISKSEIVIPIFNNGNVIAVLDIDSEQLNQFDHTDQHYLEDIATLLSK